MWSEQPCVAVIARLPNILMGGAFDSLLTLGSVFVTLQVILKITFVSYFVSTYSCFLRDWESLANDPIPDKGGFCY